jgi:hypothetical protein
MCSMRRRSAASVLLVPILLVLGATGALAQATGPGTGDALVVVTGRVEIAAGERVGDVIVLDGDVTVAGTVAGDLFVANGDVTVAGTVEENVTVVNGDVVVSDGATIRGDLTTGSTASVAPGATIGGDQRRVDFDFVFGRAAIVGAILTWIAVMISMLVLGMVFVAFAPRAAEAIATTAVTKIGPTIGWGFAMFFGIPIAAGLAIATLVGIPLGVALLLAIALLYAFAAMAAAYAVGRALVRAPSSRFASYLAGWAILAGATLIPFLGGLVWLAAIVYGLGAITVSAWNARKGPVQVAAAGALPPPPTP